jgi:hypothetical protein
MLALGSGLPLQQQPEVQQLMLAGMSAAPSVLPMISDGLQMQTADSLSTAVLLSQIQLQQQTSASMVFAGCSGSSSSSSMGVDLTAEAGVLDQGPLLLDNNLLQLQLQSAYYIEEQLTALGAALDAQLQALLAVRSEINRRRSMSADVSPWGPTLAEMAGFANSGDGLF